MEIGFDEVVYSVDESSGGVVVSVRVLSGVLSDDVVIRLTTSQDTATGKSCFARIRERITE